MTPFTADYAGATVMPSRTMVNASATAGPT